jgi:hypothetical protein
MKRSIITLLAVQLLVALEVRPLFPAHAQPAPDSLGLLRAQAPKVFIDCQSCDQDYIRTETVFVNYVRDPAEAEVHFLLTDQKTGSGGKEYTLTLIGRGRFAGMNDTLVYVAQQSETDATTRAGIARVLQGGLLRYALRTPLADHLSVKYDQPPHAAEVVDAWDYWVFKVSLQSLLNGEQQTKSAYLIGAFSANRITPDWKINLSFNANYSESSYDVDSVTTVSSFQRSQWFNGLVARSLSDHWSVGLNGYAQTSTYNNLRSQFTLAPAIEYDLFPYAEATRQQLRFTYRLGPNIVNYLEETIFDKTSETYVSQSLSIALELKQPWGTISTTVQGTHYPWDFRNEGKPLGRQITLNIYGTISWRILEGLSLNLAGSYSAIHDQFGLVKGGASRDDILLARTRLATNYSYFASFGFSYTFGSIYSNVVNPRFGSEGGSTITITM